MGDVSNGLSLYGMTKKDKRREAGEKKFVGDFRDLSLGDGQKFPGQEKDQKGIQDVNNNINQMVSKNV
ncbi:MAG: hypothetical protein KBB26_10580 [Candidatus Omnitrophica bacterium]|nr:hypothetical protein [Candidatus Omnitrophota bacterium]